ncbi:Acetyl-CoA carboxylase, biotin carboxyl carrier protein [Clostridium bornimense]|uniref:Biotin carboxyl carrier protein of acetyl-CoA carboxylase n=1 Tax=Clostridium bornimense TaxID=1216932 RepID=W6RYP4_9CLOT|nr:acetyl-CoA carboxylase biotin carboxyl carrier protein [Clostridium bornimense]CDM69771.1 Acetyl-CoA carboxylase, biotin carboxyl carrier protein [Clostridium bornimense]
MDKQLINDLITLIDKSSITSFEYEENGIAVRIKRENNVVNTETKSSVPSKMIIEDSEEATTKSDDEYKIVKSPIVGTFYDKASPEKDNFVKVGQKVSKGDTLCIIEAMKIMNEINSDFDGEIVEILCNNEDMVEFGQPLFKIR